jgi:hypothetical protein
MATSARRAKKYRWIESHALREGERLLAYKHGELDDMIARRKKHDQG